MAGQESQFSLLCRGGDTLCALPIGSVVETMRPLPLDALPGAPDFVAGMSIVRGAPVPVVVIGRLFGRADKRPERLVIVKVGERRVGFAVDGVIGVRAMSRDMLDRLPPLLADAGREAIDDIGTLDGELMVVLNTARIVPPEVFAVIETEAAAS